jgi:hypothetical protein
VRTNDRKFRAKLAGTPISTARCDVGVCANATSLRGQGRPGADLPNVHNWAKAGNADAMFKAFYDTLKPGGIMGVKDHRAKPGTPFENRSRAAT